VTSGASLFSFGEDIPISTNWKYQSIFHAVLDFFLFLEELVEGVTHV